MLRIFLHAIIALALVLPSGGCALLRKRKPKQVAALPPQPILTGTISLVNEAGRFVLIDNGMRPVPSTGARLKSYTNGVESAELVATDVRKRPFTIADIRSGTPLKGDRVFVLPTEDVAAPRAIPVQAQPEGAAPSPLSAPSDVAH